MKKQKKQHKRRKLNYNLDINKTLKTVGGVIVLTSLAKAIK